MTSELEQAREFAELFRAVYLAFHRRDGPRSQLPNASFAVLEHLALAGPLTIRLAGPAQPGHAARGDRAPDPRVHVHYAGLARPSPDRRAGRLAVMGRF